MVFMKLKSFNFFLNHHQYFKNSVIMHSRNITSNFYETQNFILTNDAIKNSFLKNFSSLDHKYFSLSGVSHLKYSLEPEHTRNVDDESNTSRSINKNLYNSQNEKSLPLFNMTNKCQFSSNIFKNSSNDVFKIMNLKEGGENNKIYCYLTKRYVSSNTNKKNSQKDISS